MHPGHKTQRHALAHRPRIKSPKNPRSPRSYALHGFRNLPNHIPKKSRVSNADYRRPMAMNTKPRLHQSLAFNLLCGRSDRGVLRRTARGRTASDCRKWSISPIWPKHPVHVNLLPTRKVTDLARRRLFGRRSTILGSHESKRQHPYTARLRPLLLRPLVPSRREVIRCGWPSAPRVKLWRGTGERKYL